MKLSRLIVPAVPLLLLAACSDNASSSGAARPGSEDVDAIALAFTQQLDPAHQPNFVFGSTDSPGFLSMPDNPGPFSTSAPSIVFSGGPPGMYGIGDGTALCSAVCGFAASCGGVPVPDDCVSLCAPAIDEVLAVFGVCADSLLETVTCVFNLLSCDQLTGLGSSNSNDQAGSGGSASTPTGSAGSGTDSLGGSSTGTTGTPGSSSSSSLGLALPSAIANVCGGPIQELVQCFQINPGALSNLFNNSVSNVTGSGGSSSSSAGGSGGSGGSLGLSGTGGTGITTGTSCAQEAAADSSFCGSGGPGNAWICGVSGDTPAASNCQVSTTVPTVFCCD